MKKKVQFSAIAALVALFTIFSADAQLPSDMARARDEARARETRERQQRAHLDERRRSEAYSNSAVEVYGSRDFAPNRSEAWRAEHAPTQMADGGQAVVLRDPLDQLAPARQPLRLNKQGIVTRPPAARATVIHIGNAPVNPFLMATKPNQRIVVNRYNVVVETDELQKDGTHKRVGAAGDKFIPAGQYWLVELDETGAVILATARPIVCGNNIYVWFSVPELYDVDPPAQQIRTPPPTNLGDGQQVSRAASPWGIEVIADEQPMDQGKTWLDVSGVAIGKGLGGKYMPALCRAEAKTFGRTMKVFSSRQARHNIDGYPVPLVFRIMNLPGGVKGEYSIVCSAYGESFRSDGYDFDLVNLSLSERYPRSWALFKVGATLAAAAVVADVIDGGIHDGPKRGSNPPDGHQIPPPTGNPDPSVASGTWDTSVVFNPYTPPTTGGGTGSLTPTLPPGADPSQVIFQPVTPSLPTWDGELPTWVSDPGGTVTAPGYGSPGHIPPPTVPGDGGIYVPPTTGGGQQPPPPSN